MRCANVHVVWLAAVPMPSDGCSHLIQPCTSRLFGPLWFTSIVNSFVRFCCSDFRLSIFGGLDRCRCADFFCPVVRCLSCVEFCILFGWRVPLAGARVLFHSTVHTSDNSVSRILLSIDLLIITKHKNSLINHRLAEASRLHC